MFTLYNIHPQISMMKSDFFSYVLWFKKYLSVDKEQFDIRFLKTPTSGTRESRTRNVYREIRNYIIIIIIVVRCSSDRRIIGFKRRVSAVNFKRTRHVLIQQPARAARVKKSVAAAVRT